MSLPHGTIHLVAEPVRWTIHVGHGHRAVACGAEGRKAYTSKARRVTCDACIGVSDRSSPVRDADPSCNCGPLFGSQAHRSSCHVAERSLRETYEAIGRAMAGPPAFLPSPDTSVPVSVSQRDTDTRGG